MRTKSFLSILLSLAVMLLTIPVLGTTVFASDTTNYDVWIGGTRITSANANDVFGDGTVRYSPAKGETPAVLTLNGYNNKGNVYEWSDDWGSYCAAIYANYNPLTIQLKGENTITATSKNRDGYGFLMDCYADVNIKGAGKLNISANYASIYAYQNLTVEEGSVEATSHSGYGFFVNYALKIKKATVKTNCRKVGLYAEQVIVDGGAVTASSQGNCYSIYASAWSDPCVMINGGTVDADGIWGFSNVTINGGKVTTKVTTDRKDDYNEAITLPACGILSGDEGSSNIGNVTIKGGTVIATGKTYGIFSAINGDVTIKSDTVATGNKRAIEGNLKNSIAGTGWTDVKGNTGCAKVGICATGQWLKYKKVQFPEVSPPKPASVVTKVMVNAKKVNAKAIESAVKKAGGKVGTIKTITLGKKVVKISPKTFKRFVKAKTLILKTKELKKSKVKNSLKGSKVTAIKVKVGSKKVNKKFVKKYKKIFTKENAGKNVRVSL